MPINSPAALSAGMRYTRTGRAMFLSCCSPPSCRYGSPAQARNSLMTKPKSTPVAGHVKTGQAVKRAASRVP